MVLAAGWLYLDAPFRWLLPFLLWCVSHLALGCNAMFAGRLLNRLAKDTESVDIQVKPVIVALSFSKE